MGDGAEDTGPGALVLRFGGGYSLCHLGLVVGFLICRSGFARFLPLLPRLPRSPGLLAGSDRPKLSYFRPQRLDGSFQALDSGLQVGIILSSIAVRRLR